MLCTTPATTTASSSFTVIASPTNPATTTTAKTVALGRVAVLQWVARGTSWYGRKKGTWWLHRLDVDEHLWMTYPHPGVVPTSLVTLQSGFRRRKKDGIYTRDFVAMDHLTMVDPLLFALTHRVFSVVSANDRILFRNSVPQVMAWYGRMQQLCLLDGGGSSSLQCDAMNRRVVKVLCARDVVVPLAVPAGCTCPVVLPWCERGVCVVSAAAPSGPESGQGGQGGQGSKESTGGERGDHRKWELGGDRRNRTSKRKAKQTQQALVNVTRKLKDAELYAQCVPCGLESHLVQECCCWQGLPIDVDPASMMSGKDQRGRDASVKIGRKRSQVQSMLALILPMVNDGETAVEFACGSGYIGLVLAALRPQVRVVLMDQNPVSIQYTKSRAAAAHLTNVECVVGDIRDFHVGRGYSLGFALHACGAASVRFGSCMLVLLRSLAVTDQHMNMRARLSWDRRCILFLLLHYITTSYTNCFFQS